MRKIFPILIFVTSILIVGFHGCIDDTGDSVEDSACYESYLNYKKLCSDDEIFIDFGEDFTKSYCQAYEDSDSTERDELYDCQKSSITCEEYNNCPAN